MEKDISIVITIYDGMKNKEFFLWQNIDKLSKQTFQDYELIIVKTGGTMGHNFNEGIKRATGRLIKFMCLDDNLNDINALQTIIESFSGGWLINASSDNPNPYWTGDIHTGNNKLGSPSALTILNDNPPLFDEDMSWLIDCDYYKKLYLKWGLPEILNVCLTQIGKHEGQTTNIIGDDVKLRELDLMKIRYA